MGLWGVFGANTVILLAGLKNIPKDLYEAATLDGAGRIRKYLNVTIPMLSPTLFYVLIMGMIGSLQTFTVAFFIDHPAPGRHLHERLHLPGGVRATGTWATPRRSAG